MRSAVVRVLIPSMSLGLALLVSGALLELEARRSPSSVENDSGDCIPDPADRCTDDVAGEDGCPAKRTVVTHSELVEFLAPEFAHGSAAHAPDAMTDAVVATLRGNEELKHVRVVGTRDQDEPRELAIVRAETVRAQLVARGVDGHRLTAVDGGVAGRTVTFVVE